MVALLVGAIAYIPLAAQFFPGSNGKLGHDYEYFLPLLLAGKYWIAKNGVFTVPYFSPAFCGGLPFIANPQSIFYSVPQLLSWRVDPVKAYLVTTVLSAWIGGAGGFLLMRMRFAASVPAAGLAAMIFMFNSFLLHRMAIGHATYYVVGLLPLLCYLLLAPLQRAADCWEAVARGAGVAAGSGAILAYIVYAGAGNLAVPIALTVVAVWMMHALLRPPAVWFWVLAPVAALLGGALAAAKLVPTLVFLAQFPRPGSVELFPDAGQMLRMLYGALFLPSLRPTFPGMHEFDYGVGIVPLIAIGSALYVAIKRRDWRHPPRLVTLLKLVALALVLAIPLWLNCGSAEFAAWLKTLPYVGENVTLVRWFLLYLLPLSLLAGLILDNRVNVPELRAALSLAGMAVTVLVMFSADQSYYLQQPYDPRPVLVANRELVENGRVPFVVGIGGRGAPRRNDALISGLSAYPCYEPVFGYALESFPKAFVVGSALRNPACYLYGRENGCRPGDIFLSSQSAAAFAAYRPFPFVLPLWQWRANLLTKSGGCLVVLGLTWALCDRIRRSLRMGSNAVAGVRAAKPTALD
ncbi:MAG: hypothetical protein ACREE4_09885 [Stellaceae bacterium]